MVWTTINGCYKGCTVKLSCVITCLLSGESVITFVLSGECVITSVFVLLSGESLLP